MGICSGGGAAVRLQDVKDSLVSLGFSGLGFRVDSISFYQWVQPKVSGGGVYIASDRNWNLHRVVRRIVLLGYDLDCGEDVSCGETLNPKP